MMTIRSPHCSNSCHSLLRGILIELECLAIGKVRFRGALEEPGCTKVDAAWPVKLATSACQTERSRSPRKNSGCAAANEILFARTAMRN
jgi:hypothetical protein